MNHRASKQVQRVDMKVVGIFKNRKVFLQLYRVLVRPRLECYAQFWSSYLKRKMETLKIAQMIFT